MFNFPETLRFSVEGFFDTIITWLTTTFSGLFDGITIGISIMFSVIESGLGFIPWFIYVLLVYYLANKFYGWKTGLVLSGMLFTVGLFGLWVHMQYTLAIVIISVLVSLLIGLPTGISMAKNSTVEKILLPILDAMQTMPSFVYLIPAVMLFGMGRVPAVFATTLYAMPPVIRLVFLGIKNVDREVIEAGLSFGSTKRQMLFKIELPQAISTIMTGVNQTTMMAMAMVVISSMIGADGIGAEVLISIRRLEVGRGFQAGFAIVFLAIILDRLLQGAAKSFEGGVPENE